MGNSVTIVDSTRPEQVLCELRRALDSGGPAILPRPTPWGGQDKSYETERELGGDYGGLGTDIVLIIETSGSTGHPKRVALDAQALRSSATASAAMLGGRGQWLLAVPVHYIAGASVLVRSLEAGTQPVFYQEQHFDAERFAASASAMTHEQRYTSLVPVQLARLVTTIEAGSDLVTQAARRFDGILIGGQSLTAELGERARRLGLRIHTTYGSSETAGGCVYDGVPFVNTSVRVRDGILEISGPTLARGYVGDPIRTGETFHTENDGIRWYRTGDLGEISNGIVTVTGRADNVIISGGEKVLLDSVERVVREIHGFSEAVVIGGDDATWGQVPIVVVSPPTSAGADVLATVRHRTGEHLGRAAAPARIVVVPEIPLLDTGKPDRVRLAADHRRERHTEPPKTT